MVAAIGGLIGSVAAFLFYVRLAHQRVLMPAWPVVAAVDIAAGVLPAALDLSATQRPRGVSAFGRRHDGRDHHGSGLGADAGL